MRTFEILLPQRTNAGESYAETIKEWLGKALARAGGFTIISDDVRGAWFYPGDGGRPDQTMLDNSSLVRVGCSNGVWENLIQDALALFPDQSAIMWSDLGESHMAMRGWEARE